MHALDPDMAKIDTEHCCTLCWREEVIAGRVHMKTKTVRIDCGDNIINLCDQHLLLLLELLFEGE